MKLRKREAKRKKKELAIQAALKKAKAEQAKLSKEGKNSGKEELKQNGDSAKDNSEKKLVDHKHRKFNGNKDRKFLKKVVPNFST